MPFDEWMKQVDSEIEKHFGLSSADITDWDYLSAWEDNYSPQDAAQEAIDAAMEF